MGRRRRQRKERISIAPRSRGQHWTPWRCSLSREFETWSLRRTARCSPRAHTRDRSKNERGWWGIRANGQRLHGHVGRHRSDGSTTRRGRAVGREVLGSPRPERVSPVTTERAGVQVGHIASRGRTEVAHHTRGGVARSKRYDKTLAHAVSCSGSPFVLWKALRLTEKIPGERLVASSLPDDGRERQGQGQDSDSRNPSLHQHECSLSLAETAGAFQGRQAEKTSQNGWCFVASI